MTLCHCVVAFKRHAHNITGRKQTPHALNRVSIPRRLQTELNLQQTRARQDVKKTQLLSVQSSAGRLWRLVTMVVQAISYIASNVNRTTVMALACI